MPELESRLLTVLGRDRGLFAEALATNEGRVGERVRAGRFLVLGGAGSIGRGVVEALFCRQPRCLHVVDANENNLVELVRNLRSSLGYIEGDFRALPLDIAGPEFEALLAASGPYDYVLNLAAMKHVRSEKDALSLMRMVHTNVLCARLTLEAAIEFGCSRYFAVSSDKAANPASAMGATKRAMELCLIAASERIPCGSARFANVAFSDGSLLQGFERRLEKRQPLAIPTDVRRYFLTTHEAATLCILSCLLGGNREAWFPDPTPRLPAVLLTDIADRFLEERGLHPRACTTEDEARTSVEKLAALGEWPCYYFTTDTSGEKLLEEFTMEGEEVLQGRHTDIGVIRWSASHDRTTALEAFLGDVRRMRRSGRWTRDDLIHALEELVPEFGHVERGRFLDTRM